MGRKVSIEELKYKDTDVLEKEIFILKQLLWLNHGCPSHALYGDDGEMQCHACMVDFKRSDAKAIEVAFNRRSEQKFIEALQNRKVNVKIDFKLKYDDEAEVHVASAPVLGISSQGEDRWQAEAALADAIESFFAVAFKKGFAVTLKK